MATPPDFSVGQTLTAAHMDAIGLWKITPTGVTNGTISDGAVTVGTTVSSVTVSGVFSDQFDNYLVTYTGGTSSNSVVLNLKLGATTSGYYGNFIYGLTGGTSVTAVNDNNNSSFSHIGGAGVSFTTAHINLKSPYASTRTTIAAINISYSTVNGSYNGYLDNATSYTSFTLTPASGTITGGTIRVYGYRN